MRRNAAALAVRVALACSGGVALGVALAPAAVPGYYLPPAGAPYRTEEIRVRAGGEISLGGTLTVPVNGKRRHPAVVLISGQAPEDRDATSPGSPYRPFYDIADTLARRGIAALRLDDRGVGSSTGSLTTATTVDRALDVQAALDYLRRRPDADPLRLGLLGIGQGATIATMIASVDTVIAALVLMAPEPDSARPVRIPALLMQGGADQVLPADASSRIATAFQQAGATDVTIRLFDQLLNTFLDPRTGTAAGAPPAAFRLPQTVRGTIADWVVTRLPARPDLPAPVKKPAAKRRSKSRKS